MEGMALGGSPWPIMNRPSGVICTQSDSASVGWANWTSPPSQAGPATHDFMTGAKSDKARLVGFARFLEGRPPPPWGGA